MESCRPMRGHQEVRRPSRTPSPGIHRAGTAAGILSSADEAAGRRKVPRPGCAVRPAAWTTHLPDAHDHRAGRTPSMAAAKRKPRAAPMTLRNGGMKKVCISGAGGHWLAGSGAKPRRRAGCEIDMGGERRHARDAQRNGRRLSQRRCARCRYASMRATIQRRSAFSSLWWFAVKAPGLPAIDTADPPSRAGHHACARP